MHFFNEEGKKYSMSHEDPKSRVPFTSYSQLSIEMMSNAIVHFVLKIRNFSS